MPARRSNGPTHTLLSFSEHVPSQRDWLSVIAEDRRIMSTTDGWGSLMNVIPNLPAGVYEIRHPGGAFVAAADVDDKGHWRVWGSRHASSS